MELDRAELERRLELYRRHAESIEQLAPGLRLKRGSPVPGAAGSGAS